MHFWVFLKFLSVFQNPTASTAEKEVIDEIISMIFITAQWRKEDFGSGGTPGHQEAIRPPAGGPGAKAPRTVAKFHSFKRCKVLENESSFQKYQHFSCQKIYFF